jgi:hypothetical protein
VKIREPIHRRDIASEVQASGLTPARIEPGLLLEPRNQVKQIKDGRIIVSLRVPYDKTGRMPGRTGSQLISFKQVNFAQPARFQMPGDTAPGDASSDDRNASHSFVSPI